MSDEADVRLIDTHAECDRRTDDHAFLGQKAALILAPDLGIEPRVIRLAPRKPLVAQGSRDALLGFLSRQAVK